MTNNARTTDKAVIANETNEKKPLGKRITSKRIAYYGLCFAMFFLAFFLDALISSLATPVSFAVLTLPIATTFILLSQDYFEALTIGFLLGFASFFRQIIYPTPSSPFFLYPHVSILPRILVGIGAYSVFRLIERLTRPRNAKRNPQGVASLFLIIGIVGVVAATINTSVVMSMMSTVRNDKTLLALLQGVILINYLPEAIAAAVISPLIVRQVSIARKIKIGGVIDCKILRQKG